MPSSLTVVVATVLSLAATITDLPAAHRGGAQSAVAATQIVVDELAMGFSPRGSGWRDGVGGFAHHHYWMYATKASTSRGGTWQATLPQAGRHRVQVKIPRLHATTRAARYTIRTAGGLVHRTVSQYRARGTWLTLGTFRLSTDPEVRLSARTGDGRAGRKIAFDAVRFVSRGVTPPPPPAIPDPPVISDIDVDPGRTAAVVAFRLDEPGPARVEYREQGDDGWLLGGEETSSDHAEHQQVISDLRRGTDHELRIIAVNAGGTTVSRMVDFTTSRTGPPDRDDDDDD
jgi:hypothetical protein